MNTSNNGTGSTNGRTDTNGHVVNAEIVSQLVEEVINGGNTRLLAHLVAPEHVTHDPTGDLYGPEGVRIEIAGYRSALTDLRATTEVLVAEDDRIARRFTLEGTHSGAFLGIAPSGRPVTIGGIAIHRFADGRLVETWLSYDCLSLIRQLGAIEARPETGKAAD